MKIEQTLSILSRSLSYFTSSVSSFGVLINAKVTQAEQKDFVLSHADFLCGLTKFFKFLRAIET